MKALLAKSPIGIFAFSESGELLYYKIWDRKNAIDKFLDKEISKDFLSNLSGYKTAESDEAYHILRKNFREYAKGLCNMTDEELNEFLSSFSVALSKRNLQGTIGRDRLVVQAIRSLDDLSRAVNIFTERLYEWYSLHYPEIKNVNIEDVVAKYGRRENMPGFKPSIGVDLTELDENTLRNFALTIQYLNGEKKKMEKYIESTMKEIAHNFSALVDPLIAARLLAAAGSLERLARMPASTIQLLGAEKALFRHMNKGGKSPKYGIIYNSNLIQTANNEHKGKIARILSSKLMLAARIDYYSGRDDAQHLKSEMMDEIKKVNA
ncbi:MAG: hypothetical protein WC613_05485 [Candidatus Aenigmatarchaeota archaeon]